MSVAVNLPGRVPEKSKQTTLPNRRSDGCGAQRGKAAKKKPDGAVAWGSRGERRGFGRYESGAMPVASYKKHTRKAFGTAVGTADEFSLAAGFFREKGKTTAALLSGCEREREGWCALARVVRKG